MTVPQARAIVALARHHADGDAIEALEMFNAMTAEDAAAWHELVADAQRLVALLDRRDRALAVLDGGLK